MDEALRAIGVDRRYRVVRVLGSGSFGTVYEVHDAERDASIALKTLTRLEPEATYRFRVEFRSLAAISHQNVVQLLELVADGEVPYFTMELVRGVDWLSAIWGNGPYGLPDGTLTSTRHRLTEVTRKIDGMHQAYPGPARPESLAATPLCVRDVPTILDLPRLRASTLGLARGVAALHGSGVIHRDIKPSNVLVTEQDRAVLVDFGLATAVDQAISMIDGSLSGTPLFMAPEQGVHGGACQASDWYAVGMMLYVALTGRFPYSGSPSTIMADKLRHDVVPAGVVNPRAPADLARLATYLLHRDPAKRPDADVVLTTLEAGDLARTDAEAPQQIRVSSSLSGAYPTLSATTSSSRNLIGLVGREQELDVLLSHCDPDAQPKARLLLVAGESGVGKSALLDVFCTVVQADGARLLRGRCFERERAPHGAFEQAMEGLARSLIDSPPSEIERLRPRSAGALARLFPVLSYVPGFHPPQSSTESPTEQRDRAYESLTELLKSMAMTQQVVVVIDDFHWADTDSVRLLIDVLASIGSARVTFVVGMRRDASPGSEMLRSLVKSRSIKTNELVVGPLSVQAAMHLASYLLGEDDEPEHAAAIVRAAVGIPLLIQQLARWTSQEGVYTGEVFSLEEFYASEFEQLSDAGYQLLEVLAVSGRPIPLEWLVRATGLDVSSGVAGYRELKDRQLAKASGIGGSDGIECYHDRVRRALMPRLRKERRMELHAALASVLDAVGVSQREPERVLGHLEAAGRRDEAASLAVRAAQRANDVFAFERAIELLALAESWVGPQSPAYAVIRHDRAEALARAGRGRDAAELFENLAKTATGRERAELLRRSAEQQLIGGLTREGFKTLEIALKAVDAPPPTRIVGMVAEIARRRVALRIRGYGFKAIDPLDIDPDAIARVDLFSSASIGTILTDPLYAYLYSTRALQEALDAGDPPRAAACLAAEAGMIASKGPRHADWARELMRRAREVLSLQPTASAAATLEFAQANLHYLTTDFLGAITVFGEAEQAIAASPDPSAWARSTCAVLKAWCLDALGDFTALQVHVRDHLRDALRRGDEVTAFGLVRAGRMEYLLRGEPGGLDEALMRTSLKLEGAEGHRPSAHVMWDLRARGEVELYRLYQTPADPEPAARAIQVLRELQSFKAPQSQIFRIEKSWLEARLAITTRARAPSEARAIVSAALTSLRRETLQYADLLANLIQAAWEVVGPQTPAESPGRLALRQAYQAASARGQKLIARAAGHRLRSCGDGDLVAEAPDELDASPFRAGLYGVILPST